MRAEEREYQLLKQKLQILLGERGDKSGKAVTRSDMQSLASIPLLESKPVTTTPTAEEYNALRRDVEKVLARLDLIAKALFRE